MLEREIARKLLEIENLPTLPAVMMQLLETVESDTSSAEDLTAILERDFAISARILRLANSAFYGLRFKVDTIRRAVVVVGFEAVRMLALATSVFDTLVKRTQFAFDPEEFWLHSLGTAKAAQLLAQKMPVTTSTETCFTVGLLHDIGKYCLALALKLEYVRIVKKAKETECQLYEVERDALQTTHAMAGMWVAQKWRLPPVITDTIGYQHRGSQYVGDYRGELALVVLASEASRAAGFGNAGDYRPPNLRFNPAECPALDAEGIEKTIEELREYCGQARQFLNVLSES